MIRFDEPPAGGSPRPRDGDLVFLAPVNPGYSAQVRSRTPRSRSRCALIALISCVALLVVVPAAAAATGSISGKVTSDVAGPEFGHEVTGIKVTAYEAEAPNNILGSAETSASGEYKLTGLAKGRYIVGFRSSLGHQLNFAPQFSPEKERFSEATPISIVVEGEVRSGVDAKLRQGASISGTVTDAGTHQPLANVVVYAVPVALSEELSVFTVSNANGEYTAIGLPSGSFDVAFVSSAEGETVFSGAYIAQAYNGAALPEEASFLEDLPLFGNAVAATAPNTTTGIDAALVRKAPFDTGAPSASGTPAVGQTLTCTTGSWTGIATLAYSYKWLRNGAAIAGASASTYVVQAADQGNSVGCEVTATNTSGSASAASNTLAVPAPVTSVAPLVVIPPVPLVVLSAAKLTASASSARVPVTCKQASCAGTIELTEQVVVKQRKGNKTISKKETLILAKGSYSLAAGRSATIALRLTSLGKSALAKAKQHRLAATAVASVTGGKTVKRSVALSQVIAKHTK